MLSVCRAGTVLCLREVPALRTKGTVQIPNYYSERTLGNAGCCGVNSEEPDSVREGEVLLELSSEE